MNIHARVRKGRAAAEKCTTGASLIQGSERAVSVPSGTCWKQPTAQVLVLHLVYISAAALRCEPEPEGTSAWALRSSDPSFTLVTWQRVKRTSRNQTLPRVGRGRSLLVSYFLLHHVLFVCTPSVQGGQEVLHCCSEVALKSKSLQTERSPSKKIWLFHLLSLFFNLLCESHEFMM